MDHFVAQAIVAAVVLFSLALVIVALRARRLARVRRMHPRAPSRRTQADAVPSNLFRPGP
jgi:hypothetical protein